MHWGSLGQVADLVISVEASLNAECWHHLRIGMLGCCVLGVAPLIVGFDLWYSCEFWLEAGLSALDGFSRVRY